MLKPADMLLTDQVAIVTGGGGGIGRGIALSLAAFGADVVIADIDAGRCEEVAERVRELGRRALPAPTDVMEADQVRAMVALADKTFGRVDILVNNAGGVTHKPFLEISERSLRRHFDINFTSAFIAIQEAARIMIREGRGGAVINVASVEAVRAAPTVSHYAAAKAAMVNLTQTLALELAEHGIRVNAINPDHTITPGNRGNRKGPVDPATWKERTPEASQAMASIIPLGREGDADECGTAAVFLASKMASYVTGVVLPVDGGTSAALGWLKTRDGIWALHDKLAVTPADRSLA